MKDIEKKFQEYFKSKFVQLSSGKWFCKEGLNETFICLGNNTPVEEFKERYPTQYKKRMDKWSDEISSVFVAKFFRMAKKIESDEGLIDCIEKAKKECVNSGLDWESVTFFNKETGKMISQCLTFRKDMFSNRIYFAMKDI
ncbi:MAG: hypothetical protein IKP65_01945 [Alphaproteobacteria bacterium]|nr:hypothetical protein [Alphaproteobacteria bacterium]